MIDPDADPRHVFLSAQDLMARYRWSRSKEYEKLKDPELVPLPLMTGPDRWRLDQILRHEDRRVEELEKQAAEEKKRRQAEPESEPVHDYSEPADV